MKIPPASDLYFYVTSDYHIKMLPRFSLDLEHLQSSFQHNMLLGLWVGLGLAVIGGILCYAPGPFILFLENDP